MRDDTAFDIHARIQCAAFEAAYLEMSPPDPASHHFTLLVAQHQERLRAEHLARQSQQEASASLADPGQLPSERQRDGAAVHPLGASP